MIFFFFVQVTLCEILMMVYLIAGQWRALSAHMSTVMLAG